MALVAWYNDQYRLDLPEGHRFPAEKYDLLREQLTHRGVLRPDQLRATPLMPEAPILAAHTADYWRRLQALDFTEREWRPVGLPLTRALVQRAHASASATWWATHHALTHGAGANLGGGTHHAYASRAEGYCVLNDVAIAALGLLAEGRIRRALVVDLDVHQGNGTAALLAHRPEVFTFSVHCQDNYPARKEASDLDIGLPAGTGDAQFMAALEGALPGLLARHRPDIVFYIAGADVLAGDRLGKLALTLPGMARRDEFVLRMLRSAGLPLVLCMGGGYNRSLPLLLEAHTQTFSLANDIYA